MNPKFDNAFKSYGDHPPRLKDMILAILWIKLLSTFFVFVGMIGALTCYYKMRNSRTDTIRIYNRRLLESMFLIVIPM